MVLKHSKWQKHLMEVYHKMKKDNPHITLREAMAIAKRSYEE